MVLDSFYRLGVVLERTAHAAHSMKTIPDLNENRNPRKKKIYLFLLDGGAGAVWQRTLCGETTWKLYPRRWN
jgi:hypothetical protein